MIGQTVCIHAPREEWSELKGRYATVTNQWGDGSVCVEVERWCGKTVRVCFTRREVEHVAMGDVLRHQEDEVCALILRSVRFYCLRVYSPGHGYLSDALIAACARRADRLKVEVRAIQRLENHDLLRTERWVNAGIGNYCTAIVPYAGGAS